MIDLLLITLACTFLANVLTLQNGPFFAFSAFRKTVGVWVAGRIIANGTRINAGQVTERQRKNLLTANLGYKSLGEIVNCPYCLGPWLLLMALVLSSSDHLLQDWLVSCGMLYIFLGWINGR